MEAKAICRNLRISPRKVRLVADLVRGMKVNDALVQLQFSEKRSSTPVSKLVRSAVANFKQMDGAKGVDVDELIIQTIFVDEGPTAKRFLPRAMGRATTIRKRSSHITVVVGQKALESTGAEG
ncbi:MAG: 50S ribosomal protein L22 [Candidatus Delongbacteria bacterium]